MNSGGSTDYCRKIAIALKIPLNERYLISPIGEPQWTDEQSVNCLQFRCTLG